MKRCAVIIPMWRELSKMEDYYMEQSLDILKDQDCTVYFLVPYEFRNEFIKRHNEYQFCFVPKICMSSREMYNSMLKNQWFWKSINEEFTLILQTDAVLFEKACTKLKDWLDEGYDYVGAPHWHGEWGWTVGNGGLSLRNTRMMEDRCMIYNLEAERFYWSEDVAFSYNLRHTLKLPSTEKASCFSMQRRPEMWFYRNLGVVPFGAHAYQKDYMFEYYKKMKWLKEIR